MIRLQRYPTTTVIGVASPKTARTPSSCCCMMLRPSISGVSGLGSERPSRVPIPAARITTCGGVLRTSAVRGLVAERARRSRAPVLIGSAVRMLISSVGRTDTGVPGGAGRGGPGEDQIEDALGGVAVLEGTEGLLEAEVALVGLPAPQVDPGDRR